MVAAKEQMASRAVIPVERTGRYPETEEVLASAATLLNGGGLGQVRTITRELNKAMGGREGDLRSLIDNLDTLATTLDDQSGSTTAAMAGLDRLLGTFAEQGSSDAGALEERTVGKASCRERVGW